MFRVPGEMRETERRLAVPSVAVVQDREVSIVNELKVIVFINIIYGRPLIVVLSSKPLKPAEG